MESGAGRGIDTHQPRIPLPLHPGYFYYLTPMKGIFLVPMRRMGMQCGCAASIQIIHE